MPDIVAKITNETKSQTRQWELTVTGASEGTTTGISVGDVNAEHQASQADAKADVANQVESAITSKLSDLVSVSRSGNVVTITEDNGLADLSIAAHGEASLQRVRERARKHAVDLPESIGGGEVGVDETREIRLDDVRVTDAMKRDLDQLDRQPETSVAIERSASAPSTFAGKLESALQSGGRDNELWVGPSGDDDNPGTYDAPLASIQTAIDRLDSNYDVHEHKQVVVKEGVYQENIVINTPYLTIQGETPSVGLPSVLPDAGVNIEPEDPDQPIITITSMSDTGYENFLSDGGASYSFTAPDTYSYTGASVTREARSDIPSNSSSYYMGVTLQSIALTDFNNTINVPSFVAVSTDVSGKTLNRLKTEGFYNVAQDVFLKSCNELSLLGSRLFNNIIFDGCEGCSMAHASRTILGIAQNTIDGDVIVANTSPFKEGTFGWSERNFIGNVYVVDMGESWLVDHAKGPRVDTIRTGQQKEFGGTGTSTMGGPDHRLDVDCGTFDWRGAGMYLNGLICNSGTWSGSGAMDCRRLECNGNFTISSGSGHVIRSGTVSSDLVLEGGSTGTLRGLTVKGDVIIQDAGTQYDFEGCHVQGSVTIDTDTTDQTQNFYGGSIIGEGHTNEVRDPEGNDVSANADWNRVSGV